MPATVRASGLPKETKIPAFVKWQPREHKQINTHMSDGEKTCSRENYKAGQVKRSVGWGTLLFICFILGSQ